MTTRSITRALVFCMAATLALASAGSHQAKADGITTYNPNLPPQDAIGGEAAYVAQNSVSYSQYGVELPFPFYHFQFINIQVTPVGPNELASFDSTLSGVANVGGTLVPYSLTGPVDVTTFGNVGITTGTFAEQMTSMDLTGMVAGHSVEIVLDPTQATMGSSMITDLGAGPLGPDLYNITSFFDVFTELSIDGGAFAPGSGGVVMSLQTIPEPGTWIMYLMAGLIVPAAYARWGRRRT